MDSDVICFGCVNDDYLVKLIKRKGVSSECSVCSKKRKAIPVSDLVLMVDNVLQRYFLPGADYPKFTHSGSFSHYEQKGDLLILHIAEMLGVDEDDPVSELVCGALTTCSHYEFMQGGEPQYSDELNYVSRTLKPYQAEHRWDDFKLDMKHGNRFFNKNAKQFLDWLFKGIDLFEVYGDFRTVIRELSDEEIYRGRRCDSTAEYVVIAKDAANQLGAPPKERAGSGRMNPAGVPAFYGAFERDTCVAELRPPVGGRVISGLFKLRRPVRVLDFITLDKAYETHPLSIFDPAYAEKKGRRDFLKTLHSKIRIPVLPDQEHEYLVTQVMAEYLATQRTPPIDGVLFASVQVADGTNLTLFNHAVIAEEPRVDVIDDLGQISNSLPPRLSAIEYVSNSLMLHSVQRVKFSTDDSPRNDNDPDQCDFDDDWYGGDWD
ncbi:MULTISPECIES: RES family NAD+ phosphorylase [Pseudomonas]|uniref:RES domain-containing protein n=1 Tax=Pseudomonas psychrophila TaxID=122355 RepID=A0ABY0W4M6_9PSED|nr:MULTISPECIES: RES family NAD+ phosphorylase [Pseudomonas]KAB0490869.1 RES family NAD+ phosphorylase [Pseudomonas psychrophila]KMM99990.1 hypothetical protein TU76_12440 [Pseudomonas psychrophila]MCH4883130.1 RES domain-containing protein [Pseudomonas sp. TMW22080]QIE34517.1 RES family NAD+ phosphorylase [Pseudomonas psychrophila]WVI96619.1 RES family NAD+ phosphorylase [Pseudomonas psychrophila]